MPMPMPRPKLRLGMDQVYWPSTILILDANSALLPYILYCNVLYCTALYCTVLFSTLLYSNVLYPGFDHSDYWLLEMSFICFVNKLKKQTIRYPSLKLSHSVLFYWAQCLIYYWSLCPLGPMSIGSFVSLVQMSLGPIVLGSNVSRVQCLIGPVSPGPIDFGAQCLLGWVFHGSECLLGTMSWAQCLWAHCLWAQGRRILYLLYWLYWLIKHWNFLLLWNDPSNYLMCCVWIVQFVQLSQYT